MSYDPQQPARPVNYVPGGYMSAPQPAMYGQSPTPAPPAGPPQRKSRTVPILVGTLVVLALLVGGLVAAIATGARLPGAEHPSSATPAAAATFTVNGTLELSAGQFITVESSGCHGTGGYDDLAMGASVTITDASGTVIGVGQVNAVSADDGMTGVCDLKFSVPNIPTGKGFYGVEVSHRGVLKYSEADLTAGPATLTI